MTLPSDIRRRNVHFTQYWESMKGSFHEGFIHLSLTHHHRLKLLPKLVWIFGYFISSDFPRLFVDDNDFSYRRYEKRLWFLRLELSSFILQIKWIWRCSLHSNASLPSDLRRTNFNFTKRRGA